MKRGEVWWINFDPSVGSEIKKTRPAVIISNDISNQALSRCQVILLTTNVSKLYPCEAFLNVNGQKCKAMADQIATVSKERFVKKMAKVSNEEQILLNQIICLQLALI